MLLIISQSFCIRKSRDDRTASETLSGDLNEVNAKPTVQARFQKILSLGFDHSNLDIGQKARSFVENELYPENMLHAFKVATQIRILPES